MTLQTQKASITVAEITENNLIRYRLVAALSWKQGLRGSQLSCWGDVWWSLPYLLVKQVISDTFYILDSSFACLYLGNLPEGLNNNNNNLQFNSSHGGKDLYAAASERKRGGSLRKMGLSHVQRPTIITPVCEASAVSYDLRSARFHHVIPVLLCL